ncbi:hypothetical protein PHYPSEUDO_000241 [Phytophthora pseudosyringae]|uniref:DUSP domain-containing protein n=1 Tax=Phytophthora pseudosyringae TaxID=221518 RepID=A0A8T1WKR6_9STRA|nr:hypothetical protein PHYPSEUDO_000241 [Phytophthora pseudosyringae]
MLALFSARKPTSSESAPLHETPGTTPTGDFSHMSGGVVKPSRIIVAGMDVTTWPIVEISVPAGPLGILLDGSCTDAALLDDFAPVTREGAPGAVEASGKVPHGSVLVGMDKFDFMQQPRKTLAEIGAVLREAAHLKRQLRFKVPSQDDYKPSPATRANQGNDKAKLITGPTSSSTNLVESSEGAKPAGEWSSMLWSGLRAATALAASVPRAEEQPTGQPTPELAAPQVKATGGSASFVRVTGMEDRPLESDKHPYVPSASDKVVSVEVPPGSLGLNLDGTVATRAVVLGFVPLADGSRGTLERSGSVSSGAEIVEINGEDVSHESLAGVRERLGRTSGEPRRLSFRLPPPVKLTVQSVPATSTATPATTTTASAPATRRVSAVAMQRMSLIQASLPAHTEDMELHRRLELKLIMSFDRKELKFKECWFAVHSEWMNRWALFVGKGGPEPGPMTNHELLVPGFAPGEDPNRAAFVRPGLVVMKDFRFVTPMVWSVLTALHGPGDAPPIARFTLDINSEAPDNITELLHEPKAQAAGLASSLRDKCQAEAK